MDLDLEGLKLAKACLESEPAALRELDSDLLPRVAEGLRRRVGAAEADEVLQLTRTRLLVGPSPKLSLYAGRGPLFGFLRAVAANVLANRQPRHDTESDDALAALPDTADLESRLLKADQQLHFREAFAAAVKQLTPRQRALLRLNLLDGLTIDEIAPMYEVHRATVARWIASAKHTVLDRTRRKLMHDLRLDATEVDSLIRLVQSRIELADDPLHTK